MIISGWGGFPRQEARVVRPLTRSEFAKCLSEPFIARGMGRSYGDSASAPVVAQTDHIDHFIAFDSHDGVLTAEAGVNLREILRLVVPKGWFLPVTPGTSYVTLAGAVASDVHGKNHHFSGTFGQHVMELTMLLGTGEVVTTSAKKRPDLFHATCGGMGLTGVILTVTLKLIRIRSSQIRQRTIKAKCLEEACEQLQAHSESTYSVAWIDCLAKGRSLGRSVLSLGEHCEEGTLDFKQPETVMVPFHTPAHLLNPISMRAFNAAYYWKGAHNKIEDVLLLRYFYPLDAIGAWNKLYGRAGFIQYQFVLPTSDGLVCTRAILKKISDSGIGSFLAVLKQFGPANNNMLSFPIEGYSLALDFKLTPTTVSFLRKLDNMVTAMGGRIYLAKDSMMTDETFKKCYSRWEEFEAVRHRYGAVGKFRSAQSERLGLS